MNKIKLLKEFQEIGYGLKYINTFSNEAKEYLMDRYNKGIQELKTKNNYPTKTGDNGYTKLLGVWYYTKSKNIQSAIGKKYIWMASILNNNL